MKILLVLSSLAALSYAQGRWDAARSQQVYSQDNSRYYNAKTPSYGSKDTQYKKDSKVVIYQEGFKGGRYYYGGHFKDKCYQDGLYFLDDRRFVYCSNGNPYIQPCAPGTRNSGDGTYKPGYYYGYSDFCNTNLVDYGYGPEAYQPYAQDNNDGYKPDAHYVETKTYESNTDSKRADYPSYSKDPYSGDRYSSKTVVQERRYKASDPQPYLPHSG